MAARYNVCEILRDDAGCLRSIRVSNHHTLTRAIAAVRKLVWTGSAYPSNRLVVIKFRGDIILCSDAMEEEIEYQKRGWFDYHVEDMLQLLVDKTQQRLLLAEQKSYFQNTPLPPSLFAQPRQEDDMKVTSTTRTSDPMNFCVSTPKTDKG